MSLMKLCSSSLQVHTFYEAVGYMIAASNDQAVQELLIEKYMLLPNQVWDSIIQQATKVRTARFLNAFQSSYFMLLLKMSISTKLWALCCRTWTS